MPTPKFKPGQSGNPAGRPKDKTPATLLRKSIVNEMPEIVKTLVDSAKNGDIQAAKVLLDRICPPLRSQALPIEVEMGDTLPNTGGNILSAILSGDIPPDIGSILIKALTDQGKLIELQEIAERLKRLEKVLEART